jgi:hypothetical protein
LIPRELVQEPLLGIAMVRSCHLPRRGQGRLLRRNGFDRSVQRERESMQQQYSVGELARKFVWSHSLHVL